MMPLYLVITVLVLIENPHTRKPLHVAVAALGFAMPLLLLVWVVRHPQMLTDTLVRYRIDDLGRGGATTLTPAVGLLHGVRQFLHLEPIANRVALYWTFLSPSYLFLIGGMSSLSSTRRAGVFLLATAPFLAIGINRILNARRTRLELLLLLGFLLAPLAALVVDDPYAIGRELGVVPFGILIATLGVESMWTAGRRWRIAAACLLVLMPVQFGIFYADYFTSYRLRSAHWFGSNLPGALEGLIALEPSGSQQPVYLSTAIPYAQWYWKFYLAKHHRPDLLARTVYFDPSTNPPDPRIVPPGSLMLSTVDDSREAAMTRNGQFHRVRTFADPDGQAFFGILQR